MTWQAPSGWSSFITIPGTTTTSWTGSRKRQSGPAPAPSSPARAWSSSRDTTRNWALARPRLAPALLVRSANSVRFPAAWLFHSLPLRRRSAGIGTTQELRTARSAVFGQPRRVPESSLRLRNLCRGPPADRRGTAAGSPLVSGLVSAARCRSRLHFGSKPGAAAHSRGRLRPLDAVLLPRGPGWRPGDRDYRDRSCAPCGPGGPAGDLAARNLAAGRPLALSGLAGRRLSDRRFEPYPDARQRR